MTFIELGLSEPLARALARLGYETPTPIQQRAIPVVLAGRDLLAAAQTGTGKTAAFALPLLQALGEHMAGRPRALVLTPTRELAAQVAGSVREYGADLGLRSVEVYGGVKAGPQVRALRRGVDIVVATPGRLLDHAQSGCVDLGGIEMLVLDEADRMLDMGFIHDIRRIIGQLPPRRQNLMFSATFSRDIRQLAKRLLDAPREIDVAPRNATADLIEQKIVYVAKHQKRELLSWMIGHHNWQQVLVFMRTKHGANRLASQLQKDGLTSAALHGNRTQGQRTRALEGFKTGQVRVLVATDIAARGIDIEQLPHVINFELPNVPEDYVHRIGRTGRAGSDGQALSLVSMAERPLLKDITRLLGRDIPRLTFDDFHLVEEKQVAATPATSKKRGGQRTRKNASPHRQRDNPRNANGHRPGRARRQGRKAGGSGKGRRAA